MSTATSAGARHRHGAGVGRDLDGRYRLGRMQTRGDTELQTYTPKVTVTELPIDHHLEHLRMLVRRPVDCGSRQQPDVVAAAQMLHHRVDEPRRGHGAPGPVLRRDRHVQPPSRREQSPLTPQPAQTRVNRAGRQADQPADAFNRRDRLPDRDQVIRKQSDRNGAPPSLNNGL